MGIAKKQEREFARMLYLVEKLSNKEISERTNTSEKTIGRWIKEGDWENLRRSMMLVKDQQLSSLYRKLEKLNQNIEDNQDNLVTNKDVDSISKLTSAIQKLEVETSLGEIIDVAKKYIDFVRSTDLEFAKKSTQYFDAFIQDKAK